MQIDPSVPTPRPSDPKFNVIQQGATQSTPTSSIYTANPWGIYELTRLTGNGWFVSRNYNPTDPKNRNEPYDEAGGAFPGLTLEYVGWDGKDWLATIVHNKGGKMLFAKTPLDPSDQTCADSGL